MNSALMPAPSLALPSLPSRALLRNAAAAMVAVSLHGAVLGLLLSQWPSDTPEPPQVRTLTTRLISLAPPAPPPPEVAPAPAVAVEPVKPPEAPKPDPRLQQQKLEQAALARKRVQEQKREQLRLEQQRQERQRIEQQRLEQQRQEAELRRQQEQLRQAELQAQAAAAASRQYLPIAKDAPDYPERALDKGIEGDCTVSYRVNPQGRVENPQVVGDCHPLFVRSSLTAARTFRYQPRVVDGQAVAVEGVKNTFHYRIE